MKEGWVALTIFFAALALSLLFIGLGIRELFLDGREWLELIGATM